MGDDLEKRLEIARKVAAIRREKYQQALANGLKPSDVADLEDAERRVRKLEAEASRCRETQPASLPQPIFTDPAAVTPGKVDFVVITTLPKETRAVLRRLAFRKTLRFEERDIRSYHYGRIPIRGTERYYDIILTMLSDMGEVSAAAGVVETVSYWQPNYLLLVGIAGGIPQEDLDLGDVVIADQVIGYDYGKIMNKRTQPRDRVYRASAMLLDRVRNFSDTAWKKSSLKKRPDNARRSRPKSFIGSIASGNKVIASAAFQKKLLSHWDKLYALEMEAEGVYAAAFARPEILHTLVIRGISDMADERKSDLWQEYAANIAAAYTICFLKSGPVKTTAEKGS